MNTPSSSLQNLPNFASLFGFDYRLKSLEDNFSELRQTNQYAEALFSIPGIVDHYLANKMQEAVDVAVQLKYDKIREESHTENQQFLDSIDEGMKKVIKEQVKKEVSKITPKIEKLVNEQFESEVLVRSSKEAKTSHAVAANLSEIELKKILIDKMEANNSINRSDIQKQLYQALVDAYEADKILLDTYGDTVTIKRPRDSTDDDQEPSARTDRGSKTHKNLLAKSSLSVPANSSYLSNPWLSNLARRTDPRESFDKKEILAFLASLGHSREIRKITDVNVNKLHQGRQYPHDLRKPLPLVPNSQGRHVIPFHHFINNDLEYLRGGESSRKYSTSVTKTKAADYGHIKWIKDLVPNSMWTCDVYSKRRIIAVTKVEIVEWQNYKHLDWITGKLTNLNVEERIAFNVSLRMFTRSVVESYQKKLNLTKPDTYRSNLRRRDAYTPYSDP
ncbi:hypothetical protein Tco_0938187, partial [Tanacetum coccineum]